MPSTINNIRTSRRGSESGLSGTESIEVENVGIPDQAISAATEEQTALGAFKDSQLQSISLICDQAVEAQFLGVRYAILQTAIVAGANTVTHTGDLREEIYVGDIIRVEGTVADNGLYVVEVIGFAAGDTTITLATGELWPAGGGGAVGTLARVASKQLWPTAYLIGTAALGPPGVLELAGNFTDVFTDGCYILIDNSTNTPPGKDGIWLVATVTYLAGVTTLTLPAGVAFGDATNDGDVSLVRPAFLLAANIPLLWSWEGGTNNPFQHPAPSAYDVDRGDVSFCMVNNETAVTANFAGRIATNAILP